MHLATSCHPLYRSGLLALLLCLTGCAANPTSGRTQVYWQDRSAGQQFVDVDFETPAPQQAGELRQNGVELPRLSEHAADPRTHRDFVDLRVTAVGLSITAGGYLLYCEGLQLPVLVPESQVDLGLTDAMPLSASIYPDRETALLDLAARAPASRQSAAYAYYRGAGGALLVPTVFSPATTPRIARTMFEVRRQLAETAQRELKVLLLGLTGTRVLQGIFSRVVRVGSGPALQPLPRQPAPRPSETVEAAPARGAELPHPRPPRVAASPQGKAGNPRASSQALKEREAASEAPLPAAQQRIRDVLLKEHSDLHPRVATEAARGGVAVQGPGGRGADVSLMNGGGREVSVHHGQFTPEALGGHLLKKAGQDGTTEIYLQINSPGASREDFLRFVPRLRGAYRELRDQSVRIFGPNGETWWSGVFGGPG